MLVSTAQTNARAARATEPRSASTGIAAKFAYNAAGEAYAATTNPKPCVGSAAVTVSVSTIDCGLTAACALAAAFASMDDGVDCALTAEARCFASTTSLNASVLSAMTVGVKWKTAQ